MLACMPVGFSNHPSLCPSKVALTPPSLLLALCLLRALAEALLPLHFRLCWSRVLKKAESQARAEGTAPAADTTSVPTKGE